MIDGLSLTVFIRALNRHFKYSMDVFTPGENKTGVYHMSFTMPCPIQETRRRVHFYLVAKKGTTVKRPTEVGLKFTDLHPQTIVPVGRPLARSSVSVSIAMATTTAASIEEAEGQNNQQNELELMNLYWNWKGINIIGRVQRRPGCFLELMGVRKEIATRSATMATMVRTK